MPSLVQTYQSGFSLVFLLGSLVFVPFPYLLVSLHIWFMRIAHLLLYLPVYDRLVSHTRLASTCLSHLPFSLCLSLLPPLLQLPASCGLRILATVTPPPSAASSSLAFLPLSLRGTPPTPTPPAPVEGGVPPAPTAKTCHVSRAPATSKTSPSLHPRRKPAPRLPWRISGRQLSNRPHLF